MDLDYEDQLGSGGHALVFLIHLTPTLESPSEVFIVLFDLLCHLLKTSPSTSIGIRLLNSKPEEITPLQPLNGEIFRVLSGFLSNVDLPLDSTDVDSQFGPQLLNALESVHGQIKEANLFSSKVFLISDCYKPFNGDANILTLLQNRIRGLANDRISLYPIIMENILGGDLNEYKSWFDTNLEFKPNVSTIKAEDVKSKLLKSVEIKRYAFDLPLEIGQLMISVRGVNILNSTELKSIKYYTDPEDGYNYPILTEAVYYQDEEEIEHDSLIKSTIIQKNQHLPILDQFDQIKKYTPGLKVKGSLPISKFNPYISTIAKFVIPKERGEFTNSNLHFTSLVKSLIDKERMLLCWGSLTTNTIPSLYYLIPTKHFKSEYPSLLALIKIPNGDEIRQPPSYLKEITQASSNGERLEPLSTKMHLNSMEIMANSVLDWKLRTMIQIATNREFDSGYSGDKMKFIVEAQREKLDGQSDILPVISAYNSIENTALFESQKQVKKQKREPLNEGNIKLLVQSNMLSTYTVPELKEFVKSKEGAIKSATKKDDLINNIQMFYS